jgi:hypothetical protein
MNRLPKSVPIRRSQARKEENMKSQRGTNLIIQASIAGAFLLALVLAIWSPVPVRSAEPADGKMMEDVKDLDAELAEQIAKMNAAPVDKKMSLMAAVITHLAEQRIALDARMANTQDETMRHVMQHMQMGKDSMSQCPMMRSMKDLDSNYAGARKEQQGRQE